MKKFFYALYAFMFNILRILPLKENKVTFLSPHNAHFNDALGEVMREVIRRDSFVTETISCDVLNFDKSSVKSALSSTRGILAFFTVKAYHLATSKYIFMNDNFMPMGKLKFRAEAVITQLWHGDGAFKRFGLHIPQPEDIRRLEIEGNKKLTYVVCSSDTVKQIYSEAFGVDNDKVLVLGSARSDYFFRKVNEKRLRFLFDKRYPECKGKKLVMYAPTFRDDREKDAKLLDNINAAAFNERLGDDYILLIKLHPQVHTDGRKIEGTVDVSDYENTSELLRITDMMITDYSSVCVDFSLMKRPIFFYAYDYEEFEKSRSTYFDYEAFVPGPITDDFQTLLNLIDSNISETYEKRMNVFRRINFGDSDGNSAKRVVDQIMCK